MPSIHEVATLAKIAHGQQTYGRGFEPMVPYFEGHILKVVQLVEKYGGRELAIKTAYLHDILEDTIVTKNDLEVFCIEPAVLQAVEVLTRREKEPYHAYIWRVGNSDGREIATQVKLADLIANYRTLEAQDSLTKRYEQALEMIVGIPFRHIYARYREDFRTDQ